MSAFFYTFPISTVAFLHHLLKFIEGVGSFKARHGGDFVVFAVYDVTIFVNLDFPAMMIDSLHPILKFSSQMFNVGLQKHLGEKRRKMSGV